MRSRAAKKVREIVADNPGATKEELIDLLLDDMAKGSSAPGLYHPHLRELIKLWLEDFWAAEYGEKGFSPPDGRTGSVA
jgi:hypothetical protein